MTIREFFTEIYCHNGYRYYSHDQIYVIAVINVLKELGMPLSEIKEYTANITPENAISLLKEQEKNLNSKIEELQSIQDIILCGPQMYS